MSLTPNIFIMVKDFMAESMFGSIVLFAVFIIAILGILILIARQSFKVGLILIFPAILAIMGIGVSKGLLGADTHWVGVLLVIAIAISGLGFIYYKIIGTG
jgi:hypothetical protein